MSTFGLVSLVVAVVSIYALWLHYKLMQQRGGLDAALLKVEEAPDAARFDAAVVVYNKTVDSYNHYISNFPGKIMAAVVGFKEEMYYDES